MKSPQNSPSDSGHGRRAAALPRSPAAWLALFVLAALALMLWLPARSAERVQRVPAPTLDEPVPAASASETAVFAGGCFWGVQGVFQHVKGVSRALSGYAGGKADTAQYERVSSGSTGHAESVQVTYDPRQVTYGQLLQIFFSVVHDPTQLDRQGPDRGSQYRSAIFPRNDEQKRIAEAYIAQLGKAGAFDRAIVTRTDAAPGFYAAESYHQDFLTLNPSNPYIAVNDIPKVEALKRLFPERWREQPVLVTAGLHR
ncbi:MAG: peptide-methionine (S)-S-oxide reductase MsrA [Solimonas sp.]